MSGIDVGASHEAGDGEEVVVREQTVPYRHRQPARPSGVQAPQVVRAACQGKQAKIQIPISEEG
ncbi:hypothetical protein ACWD4G_06790 [Streptomyces sp. NPDC002643]